MSGRSGMRRLFCLKFTTGISVPGILHPVPMNRRKTLFVFDIDGTLTDTAGLHQQAFVTALRQMGVREINTDFHAYKHHTDTYIARTIYEQDRQSAFGEAELAMFGELLLAGISAGPVREIKGAVQMLEALDRESSAGICYATGSLYQPAVYKLQQTGIPFDPAQLAASNALEERESIVRSAIEKAKLYYAQPAFERIISVGDGLWDLQTARNLGLEFIGIGAKHPEALIAGGAAAYREDWEGWQWSSFIAEHSLTI